MIRIPKDKKALFLVVALLAGSLVSAQPAVYTTANAHSHNDYEQTKPFTLAFEHEFGSIEADIFLVNWNNELLVGHTPEEIKNSPRTLDSLYLRPLDEMIRKHNGAVYNNPAASLQLMIDIKTDAKPTLQKLVETLRRYPRLIGCRQLRIVISGNRPAPAAFGSYPDFIHFDGNLAETYSPEALKKIDMLSADLGAYNNRNAKGLLTTEQEKRVVADISRAHSAGKKVRFWAIPDHPAGWQKMMSFGVDYINTDKIEALTTFLNHPR